NDDGFAWRLSHANLSSLAPHVRTQQVLRLPSPVASNTVVMNARCSLRIEADQRVIVVAGLPVASPPRRGRRRTDLCDSILGGAGLRSENGRSAKRLTDRCALCGAHQEHYAQGGMAHGREEDLCAPALAGRVSAFRCVAGNWRGLRLGPVCSATSMI